jgi:hypothetical protein
VLFPPHPPRKDGSLHVNQAFLPPQRRPPPRQAAKPNIARSFYFLPLGGSQFIDVHALKQVFSSLYSKQRYEGIAKISDLVLHFPRFLGLLFVMRRVTDVSQLLGKRDLFVIQYFVDEYINNFKKE